jgi:hypothetical protein
VELYIGENQYDPIVPIGDIAHMHSHSNHGPRAVPSLSAKQRNEYKNLILVCKNCHARLDGQKNTNTVEKIRQLKYNHEAWVRASLPERGKSRVGWRAITIGEDQWPIDSLTFDTALSPDYMISRPERLNVTLDENGWPDVAQRIRGHLAAVLRECDSFEKRVAVFPLARVTACLYAGYVLTNRPNVQLFQYHRDEHTWAWPTNGKAASEPQVSIEGSASPEHILFAFELSARVDAQPLLSNLPSVALFRIAIDSPTTHWLQHPQQLRNLGALARDTFESALARSLPSTVWHILYAGPAPGAVIVGQQLNPTMTPKTQLYEYVHPNHVPSFILDSES